jgi:glycine hydroxymethyltransferase
MLVVNAANNEKDWAWLNAVNNGDVRIDTARPWVKAPYRAELRDLRDPKWKEECRVDLALQGPASRETLLSLADNETAYKIKALKWSELTQTQLGGIDVILSRTGYTGERVAYELFVHPDRSMQLWSKLLKAGEKFGLNPCGLAARDSTRTEAGLPLYGHELAGPLGLTPREAGFGSYVKMWKPYFIGRESYSTFLTNDDRTVIRFKMDEKGVRRPELGDPVLDRRGKVIGTVTSCAIDSDGFLTGQAVVPQSHAQEGSTLEVFQLSGGRRAIHLPEEIVLGARFPTPDRATVTSRFLRRPIRKKAT